MLHRNLWAPWRMAYLEQVVAEQQGLPAKEAAPTGCFLCDAATVEDGSPEAVERMVIHRDDRAAVLLNRYPYTNGHVLIAPAAHVASLADLTPDDRAHLMELTAACEQLLRLAMNCQGVNIGLNLGRCAGAGVPGHLHIHVLPRWEGDTNFMQTVGGIRVLPQALEQSHGWLRSVWLRMKASPA